MSKNISFLPLLMLLVWAGPSACTPREANGPTPVVIPIVSTAGGHAETSAEAGQGRSAEADGTARSVADRPSPLSTPDELPVGGAGQMARHRGYSLLFSTRYKVPVWTQYTLVGADTRLPQVRRTNNFRLDPQVDSLYSSQLTDYRNSGYDRGHMVPSVNFSHDVELMDETYYLTNMCPQTHPFNSGIWLDLEKRVTGWARRDQTIQVVTGPVLPRGEVADRQLRTIGRGHVYVPDYFWKVVYSPQGRKGHGRPIAIGFVMPHRNEQDDAGRNMPVSRYAVSVDSVERLTGLDFFSIVPDDMERQMESSVTLGDWF